MFKKFALIVYNFLTATALEFIWLLCSASLGMAIVATVAGINLQPITTNYSTWLIMVLFNAAALRYIVGHGLQWLDKELDRMNETRSQDLTMIRSGFSLALRMFFKRPIDSTTDQADHEQ